MTPRKVLIHTMHGFLISAFDGTDGYLGGLANLCNDIDKLNDIIKSAINRANDCSSDPILAYLKQTYKNICRFQSE